ncbi:Rab3 GTPase-activating protein catalytic subunit [Mortierella sp. GBA30]|nr:Rab3 GTPase-activating protein catalytic subunit [Mortierella sp. GBA30]
MEEDFESFEFIDYTTSGPWERFIVQIEDCLKHWGLVQNSYGVFNPNVMPTTEGAVNLDHELALALREDSQSPNSSPIFTTSPPEENVSTDSATAASKVYQHSATVTFDSDAYVLSYQYHPVRARMASGVEQIDLDFLPTKLEGIEHHSLHRWTALTHILVLSPVPESKSPIVDLGSAKLLLSSFAIAFQNTGCNVPVFVPTGQPKNKTYTGLSIQPQLLHTRDLELGLDETVEDQAIEVRFNTVLVPYPPAQYTNLSGILDLFIERMGIEDEYIENDGDSVETEEYRQATKEQIYVSGLFNYQHDKWVDSGDDWRLLAEASNAEDDNTSRKEPRLPFGPVQDPLKSLQLVARFASAPSTVYLDSKNLTEMDANQANIWIIKAAFKVEDYGLLCGILEDVISSWSMDVSSNARAESRDQGSSEKEYHSYGSLLRKGARIIQGTIAMVDAVDVVDMVQKLCSSSSSSPAETQASTAIQSKPQQPQLIGGSAIQVVSAAELSLHFRHATTVPHNSFLWKMVQNLVDVVSPNSHITYPTSFMGFLKAVWTELLKEFAEFWEQREMIPLVDVFTKSIDRDETDSTTSADKKVDPVQQEPQTAAIDLRFNLLHQKLSMINCCIAREREESRKHTEPSLGTGVSDSRTFMSAYSSPISSSQPSSNRSPVPTSQIILSSPQETSEAAHRIFEANDGRLEQNEESEKEIRARNEVNDYDTASNNAGGMSVSVPKESPQFNVCPTPLENSIRREGALKPLGSLTLLETGAVLMIPRLQHPGYVTDDMLQEQEALFEDLGSSADAAKTRAGMQSAQLISDMSAFKAANPGCILGDFVRWHSPKDWDEEKQQMSARMAESGNFWQELWKISDPLPAVKQTPLFNCRKEALKALSSLKAMSGSQLFAELLPTICLLAYETLVSHPIANISQQVAKILQELAQELTDVPWNEILTAEKDLDLKSILAKFKQAEMMIGRFISLLHKFPEQYHLAERILEETESVVEDGIERECANNLFSAGGSSSFPKPYCREFVIETFDPTSSVSASRPTFVSSADLTGWHARPLQRRMYACFKDSEVRIMEAIAKDGMFM